MLNSSIVSSRITGFFQGDSVRSASGFQSANGQADIDSASILN